MWGMARPSRAAYFQPPLGGEDDSPYARRKSCKEKQSLSLRMREDMPPRRCYASPPQGSLHETQASPV